MPSMSHFQMSGLLMTSVSTFAIKMLAKILPFLFPLRFREFGDSFAS